MLAANIFLLPKLTCLNLSDNKELTGYLPESTSNSFLKALDLSPTGLSGALPKSVGNLHSLEILWLYQCNFNGSIPSSLCNLTRLIGLELSINELSGQVPPALHDFNNCFSHITTAGPIHPSIKNLSDLAQLDLSNNLILGSIPSSLFFSVPSLTSLDLSNNGLSGHIDEFLAAPSLDHVELSVNQLRGSIPSSIFQLGNLTYLSISGNNLTSVLDLQLLSRLKILADLNLSNNILSLSNSKNVDHVLPNLSKVSLSGCNITVIPAFLRNSTTMEYIDLSRDMVHSEIPPWMSDVGTDSMGNLIVLDLDSNLIQGLFLPQSLPNSVLIFLLARNQVTGHIPGSICEMTGLQILDFSHNNLAGTIPHCLGNLSDSLLVLDQQKNGFSGRVSLTFGKDAALKSLHLNENKFEGLLPRSVINCKQLEALDLSGNKLNDTFPKWLEILPSLRVLVLRSNRLRGSIGNTRTEFPFP
ncbi:hypothetical protein ACJRO7_025656 [Eucalyptus globulus]|uniref:Disease resistance R13L4/SHOC-2-like LRR domain-containing protein n=1 Tax=Eucalyptus globulus TaxID=34317 RepID=A0ABD3KI64_EUCGL